MSTITKLAQYTPGRWRVGDAGHTVFGPPNGTPSPEIIASNIRKANARPVAAVPEMLEALEFYATGKQDDGALAKAVLRKATGE
jgi:hypothetical protein